MVTANAGGKGRQNPDSVTTAQGERERRVGGWRYSYTHERNREKHRQKKRKIQRVKRTHEVTVNINGEGHGRRNVENRKRESREIDRYAHVHASRGTQYEENKSNRTERFTRTHFRKTDGHTKLKGHSLAKVYITGAHKKRKEPDVWRAINDQQESGNNQ